MFFQLGYIFLNRGKAVFIALFQRHIDKQAVVVDTAGDIVEREHDAFEHFALFANFLGTFGIVPKLGVFREADHFLQSVFFAVVIEIHANFAAAFFQVGEGVVE